MPAMEPAFLGIFTVSVHLEFGNVLMKPNLLKLETYVKHPTVGTAVMEPSYPVMKCAMENVLKEQRNAEMSVFQIRLVK